MKLVWNKLKIKYGINSIENKDCEYFITDTLKGIKIGLLYRNDNIYYFIQPENKKELWNFQTLKYNYDSLTKKIKKNFDKAHHPSAVNDNNAWLQINLKYKTDSSKSITTMVDEIDIGKQELIKQISALIK